MSNTIYTMYGHGSVSRTINDHRESPIKMYLHRYYGGEYNGSMLRLILSRGNDWYYRTPSMDMRMTRTDVLALVNSLTEWLDGKSETQIDVKTPVITTWKPNGQEKSEVLQSFLHGQDQLTKEDELANKRIERDYGTAETAEMP